MLFGGVGSSEARTGVVVVYCSGCGMHVRVFRDGAPEKDSASLQHLHARVKVLAGVWHEKGDGITGSCRAGPNGSGDVVVEVT